MQSYYDVKVLMNKLQEFMESGGGNKTSIHYHITTYRFSVFNMGD